MATASPTPFPSSYALNGRMSRQTSMRHLAPHRQPSRSNIDHRKDSPLTALGASQGFSANAPMIQRIDVGDSDSSDDEMHQPMKFSALTKALLESAAVESIEKEPERQNEHWMGQSLRREHGPEDLGASMMGSGRAGSMPRGETPSRPSHLKISRRSSPSALGHADSRGNSPPRIVHVGGSAGSGSIRRTISISGPYPQTQRSGSREYSREGSPYELITPAPAPRGVRVESRVESRAVSAEASVQPGSLRVKRAPVATGTFLRGAPIRRPRMRMSGDENQQQEFNSASSGSHSKDEEPKGVMEARKPLVPDTPVPVLQPSRQPLGALDANAAVPHTVSPVKEKKEMTPLRPAPPPPPPKMNLLDTATAAGGAHTTNKVKKRKGHVTMNGKVFTSLGKIGKGGSSDVYRVMAENFKIFALKKVSLDEEVDENAIRGYKGEIELLKKLGDCDRVVRLYDWELNEEKQCLSVLMEIGETDLNKVLSMRLNAPQPKLDLAFTRFYWKEMLECVQSVHDYDIVHSDLKPANFLLVSGKLKLIDFGIANAIDIDNTVNVHRDSHVGTPNYMSPESIIDTNASLPRDSSHPLGVSQPAGKMMKLGKPSDVWSLGCILYQMVYGRPPFAHIPNQLHRILAITSSSTPIAFPAQGLGNTPLPPSLLAVLRRCLTRDPSLRPTIPELLSEKDAFLNPENQYAGMALGEDVLPISKEVLGQVIGQIVKRCRDPKRGVPSEEEVRQYPGAFFEKIREMLEKG